MANGGQIKYGINFNVDKTGLNQLKAELQQIKNMTVGDLVKLNPSVANNAVTELEKIKASARQLEGALERSFNPNLGTLNVTKFNQELKKINVNKIYKDLSQAGAAGQKAFRDITTQVLTTNMHLKQTHSLLDSMAETMGNTIKWGIASSALNIFTGSVQQAYGYVKNLDTSLNNIRIVTEKSAEEMDKFAIRANNAAKSLGQSTTAYTDAALIYYQQGLAEEEVIARADTTLRAANVTGQAAAEISEQLTAVWNGFQVGAEETELYVDKLAAVAATTAADLEELSTGMSKVASAANAMGVDIDQLNGHLATVISVTRQAPESVGTAFKTIYARLGDLAVGGEDEFGVKLGDVSGKLKKMGIEILDSQGQMRDMGTVMEEVAEKWNGWTEAQRQAAAVAMAGKRQYNNLIALFDNWDMYTDAVNTSKNAMGTLQTQQDIYMESTEAHLEKMGAAAEDLYDSLLDPKGINIVIDGLTLLLDLSSNFVDSIGGTKGVLLGLGAIGTKVFSKQIASGLATTIANIIGAKENLQKLNAEQEILNQFQNINIEDEKTKELISMKEKILAISKSITEEERNIANEHIKQHKALQDQEEELNQNLQKAKELQIQLAGETRADVETKKGRETLVKELEKEKGEIGTSEHLKEAQIHFQNIVALEKNKEATEKLQKAKENYSNVMANQAATAQELISLDKLDIQNREKLQIALNKYNKALGDKEKIDANNQKELAAARELQKAYKEVIEDTNKQIDFSIKQLKNYDKAMKDVKESIDNSKTSFAGWLKQLQLKDKINNAVNLAGAFGQVASSLMSVSQIGSIWSDDTLTSGEKILQTVTSLGFALPMLASSIGQVNKVLGIGTTITTAYTAAQAANKITSEAVNAITAKGVAREQAKKLALLQTLGTEKAKIGAERIILMLSKGKITQETAEIAINKLLAASNIEVGNSSIIAGSGIKTFLASLGPVGWLFIAAGALSALVRVFKSLHKETLTAQKQLENQKKALDAVKKSYDEINQSLDTYNKATEAMQKATKGTKEWNSALQEANNSLLELIEKYPQLAKYVKMGDNGQLYITDKEALESEQSKRAAAAQRIYNGAQIEFSEITSDERKDEIASGIYTIDVNFNSSGTGFGEPIWRIKSLDRATLESILEKIQIQGMGFLKDKESFKEVMGENFLDDKMIDALLKNKDAIESLSQDLQRNGAATELYTKQIADNFLREKGISDTGALTGLYGDKLIEERDKQYSLLKTESNSNIRTDYQNLVGATEWKKEDGAIKYKIGEDWVEIEDDAARMALAMEKAGVATQDYADNLIEASTGMRGSNNYKEALLGFGANGEADLSYLSTKELEDLKNISDKQIDNLANVFDVSGENLKDKIEEGLKAEKIKRDEETTRQIGEASGSFNKYLDELVSGGYISSDQKDDFKTKKWLGEVDKSLLQDAAARGISVEDILTEVDMSQIINAENVEEAFKNAMSAGAEKLIQDQIAQEKIAQIVQEGVSQGLEAEEIEEYATHLMEVAESSEILSDDLKDNEEAANRVARATMRMNKGMDVIVENFENWSDILRNSDESSEEYADAMSDLRDAISDVLDIDDPGMLSHEFLSSAETLDLLEQAAKGSEEALEELQVAAGRDIVANIDFAPEINEEEILSKYDEMMALMPDLKVGAELDDGAFLDALNELLLSSGMTVDDVNALLGTMRLDAEFNTTEVEQTQTVPRFIIRRVPTGRPFEWAETSYQDGVDTFTGKVQVPSIGVNGEPPITKITRTSAPSLGNHSSTNAGGKKSSGGGSSKPKKQDKIDEEIDRYHDVDIQIDRASRELDRLAEAQDKLTGKEAIENLNKQLKVLKQQAKVYKEKLDIAKQEQRELESSLGKQGVKFQDGMIMNYAAAIQAQQDKYNAVVDKYNKMSAEQQEKYQETLDEAKEAFDKFMEDIERYDEVSHELIQDLIDSLTDAAYQEIELNLEKLNLELEVKLDLTEAIKDWADFEREIIQDLEDTDFLGYAQSYANEISDLVGSGTAELLTSRLNETLTALKQMDAGTYTEGEYGTYTEDGRWVVNRSAAEEQLKTDQAELMSFLTDLHEKQEEINQSYLDNIDKIDEAYQEQFELYSFIDDQLNHSLNVIKLLKGEEAYEDMAKFYEQQKVNNEQLLAAQIQQRDYYKEMMEQETDPEAAKKWKELWMSATQEVNATVEAALQSIMDGHVNNVQKAMKLIDDSLGGTRTLKAKWDVAIDQDNRYLDGVNKAYNLATLENKFNESINNVDSLKGQRELNKLKEQELNKLKEKDKLTQYDVDRANQLLDIEMKRIALEEAQQNKSKMRLRRDSSGNYSYQFVADEEAQAQAQQELLDAQNSLYNMDKEHFRETQEELFNIWQEYQELQIEYASLSDEEKIARAEEFAAKSANLQQGMVDVAAEAELTKINLSQSTYDSLGLMYEEDGLKFNELNTEKQRQLTEELSPTFKNTIDNMIDAINNPETGYATAWLKADEQIAESNKAVKDSISTIEAALGLTEGDGLRNITSSYYTEASDQARDFALQQQENIDKYKIEQEAIRDLREEIELLAKTWGAVYKAAIKALQASQQHREGQNQDDKEENTSNNNSSQNSQQNQTSGSNSSNSNKTGGDGVAKIGDTVTFESGSYYADSYGGGSAGSYNRGKQVKITYTNPGAPYPYHIATLSGGPLGWLKLSQLKGYDTGGYTGKWGAEGRLAMLHQKELVLNAHDTENMLAMVKMVRELMKGSSNSEPQSDSPETKLLEKIKFLSSLVQELRDTANVRTENLIALASMTDRINKLEELNLAERHDYDKTLLDLQQEQLFASWEQIQRFTAGVDAAVNKINADSMDKIARVSDSMKSMTAKQDKRNDLLQNIEIHADFPDATNAEEIRAAFNNLVNRASQYAYSTKK